MVRYGAGGAWFRESWGEVARGGWGRAEPNCGSARALGVHWAVVWRLAAEACLYCELTLCLCPHAFLAPRYRVLVKLRQQLERRRCAQPAQCRVPFGATLSRLERRRERARIEVQHRWDEFRRNQPHNACLQQLSRVLARLAQQLQFSVVQWYATSSHALLHAARRLGVDPHLLCAHTELAKTAAHLAR